MDADCDQSVCLAHREQPQSVRTRAVLEFLCAHPSPLFLSGWAWCGYFACRLSSLLHHDVPAWRLASPHTQHVAVLAVRIDGRGPVRARPLSRFYVACGVAASVAHLFFNPTSQVPALGASG